MRDVLHNGGVERSGNALGGCFRIVDKFMIKQNTKCDSVAEFMLMHNKLQECS